MTHPIILGITGASGAIYAARLLQVLREAGRDVHLSISPSGRDVVRQELKLNLDLENFDPASLSNYGENRGTKSTSGTLSYYHHQDFMAPMASGSFLTD